MKSVMSHNFGRAPQADIQRSTFNRSCGYKTTFDSGYLVPVFLDEALPGDTFSLNMTGFARLATPIFPFMDNVFMESFFFAIPYRLVWDNWQKFMGERKNPGDSIDYVIPGTIVPAGGFLAGSLYDYFGIPTEIDCNCDDVSALFARAYNLVWNDWFRDQNLQDSVVVDLDDGPDNPADYTVLRRCKRHDYFTSCLPWPQKGDAVDLPLGLAAPIACDAPTLGSGNNVLQVYSTSVGAYRKLNNNTSNDVFLSTGTGTDRLYADLSDATAATINELREAFQIQRMLEKDARGGTRYIEIIKSHFNVVSPDARLQRPEYLGGGSSPVNVTPIAQTSSTDATTPQGNLAAMGTSVLKGHTFTKSFVEHSIVIGLVNVRADLTYQQGLNRMFSRSTRLDFYWPSLAHLGEQAVLNKEIYSQGTVADNEVFGYQERYAEYRYKPSQVTGQYRSNFAQSLDAWHLSQDFSSLPVLNSSFIEDNPPISRVVAVQNYPEFLFDAYFDLKCTRPMPMYSVPGLIDHF
jgi:hypothetical protein